MKFSKLYSRIRHISFQIPTRFSLLHKSILLTLSVIVVLLVLHAFVGPLFYTNSTESAPRGVYIVSPNQDLSYGDYVIVRSPLSIPDIHIKKEYRLLKRVAAFSGDTYTVTDTTFETNGTAYPIYHFPWLPQVPRGTFTVPDGMMLFLNPRNDSLDCRYFGPLQKEAVERKVFLLINYDAIDQFLYCVL